MIAIDNNLAACRTAVYTLLLTALDKPSPAQQSHLRSYPFRDAIHAVCAVFDVSIPPWPIVPDSYRDFESRYLATFEVGLPQPPVVLLASHYNRHEPAPRIVHEHILFYKRFGLDPMACTGETPDHLLNELLFLIHLDTLQDDEGSSRRARRDFLARHPARWKPRAAADAAQHAVAPIYATLLAILAAAVRDDLAHEHDLDHQAVAP